jgi:hypothetical protein
LNGNHVIKSCNFCSNVLRDCSQTVRAIEIHKHPAVATAWVGIKDCGL